jgi:ketosteroid isomerase-like protein
MTDKSLSNISAEPSADTPMRTPASDAAQIARFEDERYAAMLSGDVDVLARLMHRDMVYMHSSGFADTRQTYLDNLRDGVFKYRSVRRAEQRVTVNGNVALVFHQLYLDVEVRGVPKQMSNRALAVWSYEDGCWQLLGVQSGPMPAVPGAMPADARPSVPESGHPGESGGAAS